MGKKKDKKRKDKVEQRTFSANEKVVSKIAKLIEKHGLDEYLIASMYAVTDHLASVKNPLPGLLEDENSQSARVS